MLEEAGYGDMDVVMEAIQGTDPSGEAPASGLFNHNLKGPKDPNNRVLVPKH